MYILGTVGIDIGNAHWKPGQDKGQRALVQAFIEAARGESPPLIPLAEIASVSEATLAIEESLRAGVPVEIGCGPASAAGVNGACLAV